MSRSITPHNLDSFFIVLNTNSLFCRGLSTLSPIALYTVLHLQGKHITAFIDWLALLHNLLHIFHHPVQVASPVRGLGQVCVGCSSHSPGSDDLQIRHFHRRSTRHVELKPRYLYTCEMYMLFVLYFDLKLNANAYAHTYTHTPRTHKKCSYRQKGLS